MTLQPAIAVGPGLVEPRRQCGPAPRSAPRRLAKRRTARSYDRVGNRTAQDLNPGSGLLTDSYTYPAANNRLQSVALGSGGTRSFTYDAAGNVTYDNRSGQGFGYTYDNAGRMASFSLNGVVQAEYAYNQLGQQIIRRLTWDRGDDPLGLWAGREPDCGI